MEIVYEKDVYDEAKLFVGSNCDFDVGALDTRVQGILAVYMILGLSQLGNALDITLMCLEVGLNI